MISKFKIFIKMIRAKCHFLASFLQSHPDSMVTIAQPGVSSS